MNKNKYRYLLNGKVLCQLLQGNITFFISLGYNLKVFLIFTEINPPEIIPENQRRRPSTIAEQASLSQCYKDLQGLRDYNTSTSTAPHPTAFTPATTQNQQVVAPAQPHQQQQQPQQPQKISTPQHCWKTPGAENAPPGKNMILSCLWVKNFLD